MVTNYGKGNHELSNLPRKINFALSPSRDDFPHVFINDVGLQAVKHPETGEVTLNRGRHNSDVSSLDLRIVSDCVLALTSK